MVRRWALAASGGRRGVPSLQEKPKKPTPTVGGLTGAHFQQALETALAELRRCSSQVNALNVFPVADHDTGSNLCATLAAAVEAVRADAEKRAASPGGSAPLGDVAAAAARGAFWGARGNSGAILAEYLQGLAEAWAGLEKAGGLQVARALRAAARAARAAVQAPVEGTVLTVADAVAEASEATWVVGGVPLPLAAPSLRSAGDPAGKGREGGPGIGPPRARREPEAAEVFSRAAEAARAAWRRTPEMLPVLRRAGVPDAGAAGLVVLLEALAAITQGVQPPPLTMPTLDELQPGPSRAQMRPSAGERTARDLQAAAGGGSPRPGPALYCTELWLRPTGMSETQLRRAARRLGESVVVAERDGLVRIHLHAEALHRVLARAQAWGVVEQVRAVRLPAEAAEDPGECTGG